MNTASRYPDGDEAPMDLFDERDVDQQLAELQEPGSS
jgi:hypothetical protein